MPLLRAVLLGLLLPLLMGCGLLKQLDVDSPGHTIQKPSNVAVYLSVSEGQEPITDLTDQNFSIYENDQLISPDETKLTLLERDSVAHHRTLLLVDLSAAKDDATRTRVARAVASFVAAVRKTQGVTVYAFDGAPDIALIADYPKGEAGPSEIPELQAFQARDPSRNLHGAVLSGIKELGARLMSQQKPIRVGTLVVLTTGPDRAGRATDEQVQQAVDASPYAFVVLPVGQEGSFDVSPIAKTATLWAPSLSGIGPTLEEAATKVDSLLERYYLVSYCSPARAGVRRVRVEVTHQNTEGAERHGSFEFEIDTTGFGPGCNASTPPRFGASEPAGEGGDSKKTDAKKGDDKKADAKKGDGKKGDDKKGDKKGDDAIVPPPNKPGYAPLPPK
ncbi:MAG: hypothetical protein U0263_39975 [Polyangiaceae bacterium]